MGGGCLGWVLVAAGAACGQVLPLPEHDRFEAPWDTVLMLADDRVSPRQAATFRLTSDPHAGRAIVVGPWFAGRWSARVQYRKPFPARPVEIRGRYRTVDLLPFNARVRVEYFNAGGQRIAHLSYPLAPSTAWTELSVRIDRFPAGSQGLQFAFGLSDHTPGEVWFAGLEVRPAGAHPLADLPTPELTRPPAPSKQPATGFFRVEKLGEAWWLIDPEGNPHYSLAVPAPAPPDTVEGFTVAGGYVRQLRGWGFNGLAGWHSLSRYGSYNRAAREQGLPAMPQFCVLNYHDAQKYGEYDMLRDSNGEEKAGAHGFPDPFDPRFSEAARKKAFDLAGPVRDDPHLVAWFVDNEISFEELHRFVWSRHCGRAFVAFLRERSPDVADLNRRWGTDFRDYAALAKARPEPAMELGPMFDDFLAFERRLVKRYIDVTIAATRAADPNHLVASNRHHMGSLSGWLRHIDLCGAYDLVAVNLYPQNQVPGVGPNGLTVFREVARRSGRPVILGEWSIPAIDSGLYEQNRAPLDWSYPQAVPTQTIRARQAARVAAELFNEPHIVGAHWFTYRDVDSTQREANRGLVRSDGRPWQELVAALAEVHQAVEDHLRAAGPPSE